MEFTAQQAAVLNRGRRLSIQVSTEGWQDIAQISRKIVDEALDAVRNYKGTDAHEIATLTFSWKTVEAHHERLMRSIQAAIDDAKELMKNAQPKSEDQAEAAGEDPQASGTVVKPLCDMEIA